MLMQAKSPAGSDGGLALDSIALDALTGLPSRGSFMHSLDGAISAGDAEPFVLVILGVDGFKRINESKGRGAGDEILCLISRRLKEVVLRTDVVGRLGGDEFAVLLRGVKSLRDVQRSLQAMIRGIEAAADLHGDPLLTVNIGAAHFPGDATCVEDLIRCADIALNSDQAKGKSRYTFFHPEHKRQVDDRQALLRDIEDALDAQSLLLHYQPIVDPTSAQVVAVEALLRWEHPTRGLMTAGEFQVVFECMPVAARIGKLVTEMALCQAAKWGFEGVDFGKIGINVTAADFVLGDFPKFLRGRLEHYGVAPQSICVEVTEGMFLGHSAERVINGLNALHKLGVEVAFDDFGTGYASLTHLKMPIDRLKIDRSFVNNIATDPHNSAIIQAILALGRGLSKTVTVEGVETQEQAAMLRDMGCNQYQGYLYSKAFPAEKLREFIENSRKS